MVSPNYCLVNLPFFTLHMLISHLGEFSLFSKVFLYFWLCPQYNSIEMNGMCKIDDRQTLSSRVNRPMCFSGSDIVSLVAVITDKRAF